MTFFEMLGNFSFGDYFKEAAIPYAWELVTEVLGFDPSQLWVTVHRSDDEAELLWRDVVGVAPERIQRLDDDNWWQMADTGPCGPSSEIFIDRGPSFGADGGPAFGGDERFIEIWNLVFMQYLRSADGTLSELPKPCIDTGAGLERIVSILQGRDSVFESDLLLPILDTASSVTGVAYGRDDKSDVGLRILSDHARAMTFLVSDGVFPTNEGRGYVLRRIIRRAVLRGHLLGARGNLVEPLISAVIETMGPHYRELRQNREMILTVVEREEAMFRHRLSVGFQLFEDQIQVQSVSGDVAFRLHDTYGFPIELTEEIAQERGVEVDRAGFDREMERVRKLSRTAGLKGPVDDGLKEHFLEIVERYGRTEFVGYDLLEESGRLLAMVTGPDGSKIAFFDQTPFYPEGGGQVGDVGELHSDLGRALVLETTYAVPGLIGHRLEIIEGDLEIGQSVKMIVDHRARAATRRNHTGTHLVHAALRSVLGEHVAQQGSLVAPDRLRFDYSHFAPLSRAERRQVESIVNSDILSNAEVVVEEMDREAALASGAIAFFGDRYGERVRVVRAGERSVELCGGTHVHNLGALGLFRIVSDASIGSNTRRLEAVTGERALQTVWEQEEILEGASATLRCTPPELPGKVDALVLRERNVTSELAAMTSKALSGVAVELARKAEQDAIVARYDGLSLEELRELASLVRGHGPSLVALGGVGRDGRVSLVATVAAGVGITASDLLRDGASLIGGGVGRQVDLAMTGGRHPDRIDDALDAVSSYLRGNLS
jgi:alanyl-tRNA synthetase